MVKHVKVRHRRGVLEPLEPLEPLGLQEGSELIAMLSTPETAPATSDAMAATAGIWASLLDCEAFEQEL